jgi:hypothetical protein
MAVCVSDLSHRGEFGQHRFDQRGIQQQLIGLRLGRGPLLFSRLEIDHTQLTIQALNQVWLSCKVPHGVVQPALSPWQWPDR